ncbi:MAG: RluA family pseudouridine synthase [Kiritimatiellia bacterium]|jgi:23S rRNA pseudouridine1911/1915/1917 synthase|nr:RluA family pseudouridine synthase [Kiritimatiellia bacterium]MDP6810160.1 RluA family pseudouridine synthase [Kiritimatiellia bacterium]MDP7023622.1 RluA family pseudouridine synthase [Kiritimatiellia bacterium]
MDAERYTVSNEEKGVKLLDFIAQRLGISRNAAKGLLNARHVFVNRKRIWMARHPLRARDVVEIVPHDSRPTKSSISTLYEDDDYIVVNKPAATLSNGPRSLEERLQRQEQSNWPCCVHRLDKDTTGCLLLARHEDALEQAMQLFKRHDVNKVYRALVAGTVKPEEQTIRTPIGDESAVSHVRVLDSTREASHVSVRIETGRTHQIRKHLAGLGHPVIGDRQYGSRSKHSEKLTKVGRQMLHAYGLQIKNPVSGGLIRAKAPLPHDFRRTLRLYGLT